MLRWKKWTGLAVGLILIAAAASGASAQDGGDGTCPALVETAYRAAERVCIGTGRDQACYAHAEILAAPDTLAFSQPGDVADLSEVESLRLSALDLDAGTWGLSLLRIQADLPDEDPNLNVKLLLFGDVEITNRGRQPGSVLPQVRLVIKPSGSNLNIRSGPSTDAPILDVLPAGQEASANGRSAAGDWLRIVIAGGEVGWVYAPLVTVDGDMTTLAVVEGEAAEVYGPMEAFLFRSGVDDAPCAAAPESGLLIQTPQGVGEITLLINEVTIELGSTAYLQAEPGAAMLIRLLEGQARITAQDETVTVVAGQETAVPLDEAGIAAGPPGAPAPYDPAPLEVLPLRLLPRSIQIAQSASGGSDPLAGIGPTDACTITPGELGVNLRGGPGTNYPVRGQLAPGDFTNPVGKAQGADGFTWWRLPDGLWVRADVVRSAGRCAALPTMAPPPPDVEGPPAAALASDGTQPRGDYILVGDPPYCGVVNGLPLAGRYTMNMGLSRARWATCEDARAEAAARGLAVFGGNGPAPSNYRLTAGCHINAQYNEIGISTEADVILAPGVYTYTATWLDGETRTCTFTIQ